MEIIHNSTHYKATPLANGSLWRLTSTKHPRESVVLTRDQMVKAGLGYVLEPVFIDVNRVRAAQNKIVIARFLQDDLMWHHAVQEFRQATGAYS